MKFGHNLDKSQIPEWASFYVTYKPLKRIIKQIAVKCEAELEKTTGGDESNQDIEQLLRQDREIAAPFFNVLDRDVETVESFFDSKHAEYVRRLNHFRARYPADLDVKQLDRDEKEDLVGLLVELRTQFRKLQWYQEINNKGFVKILKKFDKKLHTHYKDEYMKSIAFPSLDEDLAIINEYLSKLGPEQDIMADKNETVMRSLTTSPDLLASHQEAIARDDPDKLCDLLNGPRAAAGDSLIFALVSKAMSANAKNCMVELSSRLTDWTDPSDLNGRNILHRAVISRGRHNNIDDEFTLRILACKANRQLAVALFQPDAQGRLPLHYAGYYGLETLAKGLIESMCVADPTFDLVALLKCTDADSASPLHLATSYNYFKTARTMLNTPQGSNEEQVVSLLTPLLFVAAQLGSVQLCDAFIKAGVPINHTSEARNGETAVFVASKLNHVELVRYLIGAGADFEIAETVYGWTPLVVAAVDGNDTVSEILLESGARVDRVDGSGWTAMEHACLRGHLELAKKLKHEAPKPFFLNDDSSSSSVGFVTSVKSAKTSGATEQNKSRSSSSVKLFGHRYLKDNNTMVLVTLGSSDVRLEDTPVKFFTGTKFSGESPTDAGDTALSLVVSAENCVGDETVIDLPDSNLALDPCTFYTQNPADVCLYFDLVPTYGSRKKIIGRAAALLSSIYTPLGTNKRSLHESVVLPIVQQGTLKVIGSIRFSCLIITPFTHPNVGLEKSSTYWKSLIRTRVIGHRGLGKNTSNKSLQLGENTIESFVQAANLGASYVEFDVQLTKDKHPVIYHDFLVAETGLDVPMHTITLEQFKSQNTSHAASSKRLVADDSILPSSKTSSPSFNSVASSNGISAAKPNRSNGGHRSSPGNPRQRSQSMYVMDEYDEMAERLKHTRDFKVKGFKGNFRGHSIQSPFLTLEEVFRTLPMDVGFNIECKYPMLDETEAEDMENFAFELNMWVDTVLKCVYDNANGRDIIFSSFHPDLCILLAMKQPSYPILFLTEGGSQTTADVRASSLQEAIRFARRWNLLGIVSECTPLLMCPRLVRVVKESGLVCVTYGVGNNDPVNAQIEMRAGVDAVIVDSVLAVRRGLTEEAEEKIEATVSV